MKLLVIIAIEIKINYAIAKDIFFNNFMHNFVVEFRSYLNSKQELPNYINDIERNNIQ